MHCCFSAWHGVKTLHSRSQIDEICFKQRTDRPRLGRLHGSFPMSYNNNCRLPLHGASAESATFRSWVVVARSRLQHPFHRRFLPESGIPEHPQVSQFFMIKREEQKGKVRQCEVKLKRRRLVYTYPISPASFGSGSSFSRAAFPISGRAHTRAMCPTRPARPPVWKRLIKSTRFSSGATHWGM